MLCLVPGTRGEYEAEMLIIFTEDSMVNNCCLDGIADFRPGM